MLQSVILILVNAISDMCMVFEVMGDNLLSLIKRYNYRGIPVELVKVIALQTLIGLNFLHTKCGIIHTDLKPENFLLGLAEPLDLNKIQEERKKAVEEEEQKRFKARLEMPKGKLNKNQKKRLKAKLKKEAEKEQKSPSLQAEEALSAEEIQKKQGKA